MIIKNRPPALLLIDIQKGLDQTAFYGGGRNNLDAESKAAQILNTWRKCQWPIFHIQHSSQNPTSPLHAAQPGFMIKDEVKPLGDELVIVKEVNSAFIGTDLSQRLEKENIKSLVIVGLTTNHCISTTARMASNLGYRVILIADAMACFDRVGIHGEKYEAELMHLTALASLQEEFAEVKNTEELLRELAS